MDRKCLCIFTCIFLFLLLDVLILNKNKLRLSHNLVHTGWGDFSLSSTTWVWSSSVSIFSKLNFVKVLASVAEGCLNHRCKHFFYFGSLRMLCKTPIVLTSIWTNTIMWAFEKYCDGGLLLVEQRQVPCFLLLGLDSQLSEIHLLCPPYITNVSWHKLRDWFRIFRNTS